LDEALDFCESSQEFWQKGELESALEALDKAYSLILDVEADGPPNLVQQKEDLRFLISKRILEIYASRNIVVNGNHNAIPREINTNVEKEIKLFTKGPERRFFIASYQRSGKYRPMILKKLAAAGLPEELSWLPLIESGFKVKALSRARALGLWQFIPSTGYKFGLKRNQYIDERIDFEKSTDAAIAYLKELHKIFGDWATVLAAYNCGEGRVLHVIRTQKINYLDDFWDLFGRLPYETARYVPRFLAALHIIENQDRYGLSEIEVFPPLDFETVNVHRQVHLKDLAIPLETPLNVLKELNPELRYSVLPPDKYEVRVPVGKEKLLLASIDQIPLSSPPQPAFVYHRVRKGETLSTIAHRYRTSVKKIMWANNMRRSSYIVAGRKIKIPQRGMVVTKAEESANRNWNRRHVVKRGDSLWNIANRYGTTTQKIQEMNALSTTRLRIHQVLKVPSDQDQAKQSKGGAGTYYVKRGDSPYLLARRYNISLSHFLEINNLTLRSTIYPGQKVKTE
jgi:membrane-bound lytic murein transglycosylase D